MMQKKVLGTSSLSIAPIAFGGNIFGWTVNEQTSFELLDAFVAMGFNFIDTADIYSTWVSGNHGGESETIIGKWLKKSGHRSKVIIATKVGMEMPNNKKGLSKTYIMQAVEDSLRRLQTDYIDLYQSHIDDEHTELEETLSAYNQLIQQGKVRVIGASNYSAARLEQALQISKDHHLPRYECLQPHYNLYNRAEYENELEFFCMQNNMGVISYSSLANGFLTGKYRSQQDFVKSARGPGMKKYLNDRGYRILQALDEMALQYSTSLAGIAIAWLIAKPSITAPIVSATTLSQLNEFLTAVNLKLKPETLHSLNQL